jgi:hypothetical protein
MSPDSRITQHDEEEQILKRLRRGERIEHYVATRIRKDGSPLVISLSISPIKESTGKMIGASRLLATSQKDSARQEPSRRMYDSFVYGGLRGLWWSGFPARTSFVRSSIRGGWILEE